MGSGAKGCMNAPSPRPPGKIPVLLVEDDHQVAIALRQLLGAIDRRIIVDWVTSAESAALLIARKGYSVVLCDHNLAGVSKGYEVWQSLGGSVESYTRFILMSARSREDIIAELEPLADFPEFLQKPFEREDLEKVIRQAIFSAERS